MRPSTPPQGTFSNWNAVPRAVTHELIRGTAHRARSADPRARQAERVPSLRSTLVFGSDADLEATRTVVEARLRVSLALHDSLYRGGDYYRGATSDDGEIIVQTNAELDEPIETIDAPTVVYVDTSSPGEVRRVLDRSPLGFVRAE
jgi:hypothetical protein